VVHAAGQVEQVLAGVVLQLAPPGQRGPGQVDVLGVVVGEAEDAGAAVGAAPHVARLEALEEGDRTTPPDEVPGGGRAHGPGPHHDDVDPGH
jgi:hypothetical protein